MKTRQLVEDVINEYSPNEIFFAGRLYKERLSEILTEAAYYKILERMCNSHTLLNIARGIYCRPEITPYGLLGPSEAQILKAFTDNDSGIIVGYTLYNHLGLTTQVSKRTEVFSHNLEQDTKTIGSICVSRHRLDYSKPVSDTVAMLEVLKHFNEIQDMNYKIFIEYAKEFANNYRQDVFEYVSAEIKYQKRTIAFLREILNYYGISNNLSKHLSALTRYNYPTMEKINELARV